MSSLEYMSSDLTGVILPYLNISEQMNMIMSIPWSNGSVNPSHSVITLSQFLKMTVKQQSLVRDLEYGESAENDIMVNGHIEFPIQTAKFNLPKGLTTLRTFGRTTIVPTLPDDLKILSCQTEEIQLPKQLPRTLIELNCDCRIVGSVLPVLPPTIRVLKCRGINLPTLHTLGNLEVLKCSGGDDTDENEEVQIPELPDSLLELDCYCAYLTSLPILPPTLHTLNCFANYLTSLPVLPTTLTVLNAGVNNLTSSPILPPNLRILNCNAWGTPLPDLPSTLIELSCCNLKIKLLPPLPPTLEVLNCSFNCIVELPPLPSTLTVLNCSHNSNTSLPTLPIGLVDLTFGETNNVFGMVQLPTLPVGLISLTCYRVYIPKDILVPLQSLQKLELCHRCEFENNLLPVFPESLRILDIHTTLGKQPFYRFPSHLKELYYKTGGQLITPSDLPRNLKTFIYHYKSGEQDKKETYQKELPGIYIYAMRHTPNNFD